MVKTLQCTFVALFATLSCGGIWLLPAAAEETPEKPSGQRPGVGSNVVRDDADWLDDYLEGVRRARTQGRMLLIYFAGPDGDAACRRFWEETLAEPAVIEKLRDYVCVRLPLDAEVVIEGEEIKLIGHFAFREMLRRPGVAIVDYRNREAEFYGQVVSTFPLTRKLRYTAEQVRVILDLPPGTLTQRTLIYAVRTHPERPKSTDGTLSPVLADEAHSHCRYQANIRLQGHHQWGRRFHRINARLPGGLVATEVCAESWPGENLVEAAIECVRSWRLSSGHWSAVRAPQRMFGYDMKRGSNGIWYATGIFGGRQ